MLISENINKEISKLNVDEEFKRLMLDILRKEDEGVTSRTYKGEYSSIVDAYIKAKEDGNGTSQDQPD